MVKPGMNNQAKQGSNEIETLVGLSDLMTLIVRICTWASAMFNTRMN
jgi:hypothetical protein